MTKMPEKKRKRRARPAPEGEGTCFVMMPFGGAFDRYFLNIYKPAVEAAGLRAVRADSLFTPTQIIRDVWQMTQAARVLLADLSGKNPNVFYELGLAHALSKPVVLTSHGLEDVPFDLQSLRVILYDKNDEMWGVRLRDTVTRALVDTLHDAASAIPLPFVDVLDVTRPKESATTHEFRRLWEEVRRLGSQVGGADVQPDLIAGVRGALPTERLAWATDATLAGVITSIRAGRLMAAVNAIYEATGMTLSAAKDLALDIQTALAHAS